MEKKATAKHKPAGRKKNRQLGLFEPAAPQKQPVEVEPAQEKSSAAPPQRRSSPSMAERLAREQREISVSEFFSKNRHLLGFDNPQKALLTAVKEAVDNSLDACEEAGILPEIKVSIQPVSETRFKVVICDNGPGIIHGQVGKIFGKLLYGSKFHRLKQSRGQQGIGISAAVMYSQLTTGKPVIITSRTRADRPAHRLGVKIDTRRNAPEIVLDEQTSWPEASETGTLVELELEGVYRGGKRSVDQYIQQTAIANPHATIHYHDPMGQEHHYNRLTDKLPPQPTQIKPHPHGVELGMLASMLKETRARNLKTALSRDFSRVSERIALAICQQAGVSPEARPHKLALSEIEALHRAMGQVKIISPPTSCVVPIGEELLRRSLEQGVQADFFTSITRPPAVYRGNPFQIEAALAWGGNLPAEELCTLLRFANRVPLQYQQSDCAITRAVMEVDWRNYRVQQARGALPSGPLVVLVHIASVWVPFTSESKEAVARYPEIVREIKLALQQLGRRLGLYLSARRRDAEQQRKASYIETYIPHIGIALQEILGLKDEEKTRLENTLKDTLQRSRRLV